MDENWKKLGDVVSDIVDELGPATMFVNLPRPLIVALFDHAAATNHRPETIIQEAVRVYLGDAA